MTDGRAQTEEGTLIGEEAPIGKEAQTGEEALIGGGALTGIGGEVQTEGGHLTGEGPLTDEEAALAEEDLQLGERDPLIGTEVQKEGEAHIEDTALIDGDHLKGIGEGVEVIVEEGTDLEDHIIALKDADQREATVGVHQQGEDMKVVQEFAGLCCRRRVKVRICFELYIYQF